MIVDELGDGLGCLNDLLDIVNLLDVYQHKVDAKYNTWCLENVVASPSTH